MRLFLGLAAGMTFVSLAAAQTPNNYEIYPDPIANQATTTYTTRGTLGSGPGEVLQEWPINLVAGIGDNGTTCQFVGAEFLTQDQDASTPEQYSVVARADAMGMPDVTALLLNATGLSTPAGTGITAWRITVTFASPFNAPCDKGMYVGLGLSGNATWTADGQSLHGAAYVFPGGTFPMVGDHPRQNAPKLTWNVANMVVSQPGTGFVYSFAMRTNAPVLNIGNEDPLSSRSPGGISYGAGGFFPDVKSAGRDDGLRARVRDNANTGGMAFVLLGTGSFPMGLALGGFQGHIYLSPAGLIMSLPIWQGSIVNNEALIQIAPPTAIPAPGWNVYFQAITVNASLGNARFTNLAGVSL